MLRPGPSAQTAGSYVQAPGPGVCRFPWVKLLSRLGLFMCLWEPRKCCQSLFHAKKAIFCLGTKPCKKPLLIILLSLNQWPLNW